MPIFMETTEVPDTRTAAQIQELLAAKGAKSIMVDYQAGQVEGLSFIFRVRDQDVPFRLPCRWRAVSKALEKSGRKGKKKDTWESWGRRVAWRQVLRWVEAQLALIETGMVATEEVFLPYAIMASQKTVYDLFADNSFKLALPDKSSEGE